MDRHGSEEITKAFIEKLIKKEVESIDLDLNVNLVKNYYDEKLGILDVRARTKSGINYNIEMQNVATDELSKRILSYWSRLYIGNLKRGNNYDILAKTIVILIVNDKMKSLENIKKYHSKWNIREEDYNDIILTDDFEIHIIELEKYKEESIKQKDKNVWLDFIMEPESEGVMMAVKKDKVLKKAKEKWDEVISDEQMQDRALRLEIAELDKNTALKHAEERGRNSGLAEGEKIRH